MKKALATIMGLAFAVSAMAQYLIYDYNVSFKRLDAQFTKISYEFDKYDGKSKDFTGYFDSFKTASDKLVGTLVIDSCKDCNGEWENFGTAGYTVPDGGASAFTVDSGENEETSMLFVYRNGDNLSKNPHLKDSEYAEINGKLLWSLEAKIDGAMFGKNAAVRLGDGSTGCRDSVEDTLAGTPTSLKAAKEAYAVLTYDVPAFITKGILPPINGLNPTDDCVEEDLIDYGFLGYLCGAGNVSNAGFGSTSIVTTKGNTTIGFCGSKVKEGASCIAINKISGSTIGYFNYDALCSAPALFDVCSKTSGSRKCAPMCGTFTLKLNAAQSKKATSEEAVEDYLEKKYKNFWWFDVE